MSDSEHKIEKVATEVAATETVTKKRKLVTCKPNDDNAKENRDVLACMLGDLDYCGGCGYSAHKNDDWIECAKCEDDYYTECCAYVDRDAGEIFLCNKCHEDLEDAVKVDLGSIRVNLKAVHDFYVCTTTTASFDRRFHFTFTDHDGEEFELSSANSEWHTKLSDAWWNYKDSWQKLVEGDE